MPNDLLIRLDALQEKLNNGQLAAAYKDDLNELAAIVRGVIAELKEHERWILPPTAEMMRESAEKCAAS